MNLPPSLPPSLTHPLTQNCTVAYIIHVTLLDLGTYCSVPDKRPCTAFQGAAVAASIQMYRILIPPMCAYLGHYGSCMCMGFVKIICYLSFHAYMHTHSSFCSWVAYRMVSVGVVRCWRLTLTTLMPCVTELSSMSVSRCTRKPSRTTRRLRMWRIIHKRYSYQVVVYISFCPPACDMYSNTVGIPHP